MAAPDTWSWAFYSMKHFDMLKHVRNSQKKYGKWGQKPEFMHTNKSTTVHGWEDNKFTWLTASQDDKFAFPGPAFGHRSD
jgi:hypothetical protein